MLPGRGVGVEDDTDILVEQLCTRIGMIMEDASIIALTIRGRKHEGRGAALAQIETAAFQISALLTAARALQAQDL